MADLSDEELANELACASPGGFVRPIILEIQRRREEQAAALAAGRDHVDEMLWDASEADRGAATSADYVDGWNDAVHANAGPLQARLTAALADIDRLRALINTPQTDNFVTAVQTEAAHQVERWGAKHDAGKQPADWFWLIGYLAGKALHDVRGKRVHHIIATAAALLNWHRQESGESNAMRPGIDQPKDGT